MALVAFTRYRATSHIKTSKRTNPMANTTPQISVKEYRLMKSGGKPSKYRNQRVESGGTWYDSKKEANRHTRLLWMQRTGMISDLKHQVPFTISVPGEHGAAIICKYIADFTYNDADGKLVVEDVKSAITRRNATYRLKNKLMKAVHGIEILEV